MSKRIAIIGGGGWGLAIAKLLADNGNDVLVWEHNTFFLEKLNDTHSNSILLPKILLPQSIAFTGSLSEIADFLPELIVLATPSQFLRSTLTRFVSSVSESNPDFWIQSPPLAMVNLAKGIEENTLCTMSQIAREILIPPLHKIICTLSGPSHAEEVAKGIPTTVVIAGASEPCLIELQKLFSNSCFRVYRSDDLIGVEIGGAVKNIIAIAAGIIDGLGYGDNTKGALLTRGIVEIQRLGMAMGAKADTFLGLSGIGDMITTAISLHSRNRYVGYEIGKGRKLSEIVSGMQMVAEGVATTRSVFQLANKLKVDMPITNQIYSILYEDKKPLTAITELMTRGLKAEA